MTINISDTLTFAFCLSTGLALACVCSSCQIQRSNDTAAQRWSADSDEHSDPHALGTAGAILSKDEADLKAQLAMGANPRSLWRGERLIQHATSVGFKRGVELLVAHGAKVDDESLIDSTALMDAASAANSEMITLLLALGANVNYRNRDGQTALMVAAAGPATDRNIESGSIRSTDPETVRERAAHLEAVRLLLNAGARVNVRSRWKETPLKNAENSGQKEIADLLRARGAR